MTQLLRAACACLAVLSCGICSAQHLISGTVTDSASTEKIEFVSVRLLAPDSTLVGHTITDSIGKYSLSANFPTGFVSFSSVGYTPRVIPFRAEGPTLTVNASLTPSARRLNEIVVESNPIVRNDKGGLTAIPNKNQKQHASGGYDLLANLMIPGLTVNKASGEVGALFGSATLYINGVKATPREVKALRAADILKVEYFDAPTGIYAGENAVVNYVVRQYETGGYFELTAKQKLGWLDGDYNLSGKIAHKNTTIKIFGGHNLTKHDGDFTTGETRYNFPDRTLLQNVETNRNRVSKNNSYAQVDVSNANKKRQLRASVFYNRADIPSDKYQETVTYSNNSGLTPELRRTTLSTSLDQNAGLRLYGHFNLQSAQFVDVSLNGTYTKNRYTYNFSENDAAINSKTDEHSTDIDLSAIYGKNFKRGNSLTVRLFDFYKNNDATYHHTDNDISTGLWRNEAILFVQYFHPFSKKLRLMVQPGLSSLVYRLRTDQTHSNFSPRLNVRLSASLPNNQSLMVAENIGNAFPGLRSLSTAEQQVNPLHVIVGNPDVKNTKLYQSLIVYGYNSRQWSLQVMAQYQHNHNLPVSSFTTDGNRIIESLTTNANGNDLNTNASLTFRPIPNINLQLSGGYNLYRYTGYQTASAHGWEGRFNAMGYFGKFAVNLHIDSPQTFMGMDLTKVVTPWQYGASLSFATAGWRIEAGADNVFTHRAAYRFNSFNPVYNYSRTLDSRTSGRVAYLTVAYSFDFGRATDAKDLKRTPTYIENTILKAK